MSSTKRFTTYGKRNTRTIVTPTEAPSRTVTSTRSLLQPASPPTSHVQFTPPGIRTPHKESPPKRKGPVHARKRHEHVITPKRHVGTPKRRRVSILSIASVSRPVIVNRRGLRAVQSPVRTPRRIPSGSAISDVSTIESSGPLREADVNIINNGQEDDPSAMPKTRKHAGAGAPKARYRPIIVSDDGYETDPMPDPPQSSDYALQAAKSDGSKMVTPAQPPVVAKEAPALPYNHRTRRDAPQKTVQARRAVGGAANTRAGGSKGQTGHAKPDSRSSPAEDGHSAIQLSSQDTVAIRTPRHPSTPPRRDVRNQTFERALESPKPSRLAVPGPILPSISEVGADLPFLRHQTWYSQTAVRTPVAPANGPSWPSQRFGRPAVLSRRDSPIVRRALDSAPAFDDILSSLGDISLSSSIQVTPDESVASEEPTPLAKLLKATHQDEPADFAQFTVEFPTKYYEHGMRYRKVGEASYSEVFGVGDIVIKVIPLLDVTVMDSLVVDEDRPEESAMEDVLREILFVSKMGSLPGGSGFVALLGAHIVQGAYPPTLLSEWDVWDAQNTSESIRPGCFTTSQLYAVIEMAYSGVELEKYTFSKKVGWAQAASVFWQVATALARAEEHLQFEHRDLHWGQVLIMPLDDAAEPADRTYMDDACHGVVVTIIDFGFSRMDGPNPGDPPLFTKFDDEVFEGEGDYQYDIYRMMRDHNGDEWAEYRPMTNLMWLHYLATKCVKSKGLRKPVPGKDKRPAALLQNELRCNDCLCEVERHLRDVVANCGKPGPKTRSRSTRKSDIFDWKSAGDFCQWARSRGWIA